MTREEEIQIKNILDFILHQVFKMHGVEMKLTGGSKGTMSTDVEKETLKKVGITLLELTEMSAAMAIETVAHAESSDKDKVKMRKITTTLLAGKLMNTLKDSTEVKEVKKSFLTVVPNKTTPTH